MFQFLSEQILLYSSLKIEYFLHILKIVRIWHYILLVIYSSHYCSKPETPFTIFGCQRILTTNGSLFVNRGIHIEFSTEVNGVISENLFSNIVINWNNFILVRPLFNYVLNKMPLFIRPTSGLTFVYDLIHMLNSVFNQGIHFFTFIIAKVSLS